MPGIHVFLSGEAKDVDGRDKPGHDELIPKRSIHARASRRQFDRLELRR
jgi:hypothetical protein